MPALVGAERWRAADNSFATWMANANAAERRDIAGYVLGRETGALDVEIIRRRLWDDQFIVIARDHPLAETVAAAWDGQVLTNADCIFLTDPGPAFLDPLSAKSAASERDWPKISVVTVSYNQAEFLTACLRSVMDQGYPNLEYIVVDCVLHGWEPGHPATATGPYSKADHRAGQRPIRGPQQRLRIGHGDILTWINSDDELAPGALKRAATAFRDHDVDIIVGNCQRIRRTGQPKRVFVVPRCRS